MKKTTLRRVKIARTVAVFLAAAPLFQFSQCITFNSMVGQSVANGLPNLFFSTLLSLALSPLQGLLATI